MASILVIDDDRELTGLLAEYLLPEGLTIQAVHDGENGLREALEGNFALVILDIMLPRLGGLAVLKQLRQRSTVPVLMLTARGGDTDRIIGLREGADDYLPKPFNPHELVARVHAILRRTHRDRFSAAVPGKVTVGDVALDSGARSVYCADQPVELTSAEFDLLQALMTSAGKAISREDLFRTVLGRPFSVNDRSIDNHVYSLRKKLGPRSGGAERIKSIRNAGYLYARLDPLPRS